MLFRCEPFYIVLYNFECKAPRKNKAWLCKAGYVLNIQMTMFWVDIFIYGWTKLYVVLAKGFVSWKVLIKTEYIIEYIIE